MFPIDRPGLCRKGDHLRSDSEREYGRHEDGLAYCLLQWAPRVPVVSTLMAAGSLPHHRVSCRGDMPPARRNDHNPIELLCKRSAVRWRREDCVVSASHASRLLARRCTHIACILPMICPSIWSDRRVKAAITKRGQTQQETLSAHDQRGLCRNPMTPRRIIEWRLPSR